MLVMGADWAGVLDGGCWRGRGCNGQVAARLPAGRGAGLVRPRSWSGSRYGSRWQARSWAAIFGTWCRCRIPMTVLRMAALAWWARLTGLASSPKTTSRIFSRGEALPGELDLRVSAGQWLVSVSISDATGVVYLLRCFVLAEGGGPWFAGGRRGQGGGQMTAVGALGFQ